MAEEGGELVQNCGEHLPALDLDLDEIDDNEFDIPKVDKIPTLESILNAPDDDLTLTDASPPSGILQGDSGDTGSVCSQDSINTTDHSTPSKRPLNKCLRYSQHGAVLRHVILKMVSAQLVSAADRVDAGLPTALAAASLVAVGTSHGVVLVFDSKQTLRWCLGGAAGVGAEFGAVSTLSLNNDCTRLLVGYARGQLTMWDLTNGKLLRTVTDAHPPGIAVLNVKFTDDKTVAVMSDSGGSVYCLEFKRLIGVRTCDSRCLFSGSRGEVCIIEPLCYHNSPAIAQHTSPARDLFVLAMASLSKVLIVVLRPELKVRYVHTLAGDSATLPLLAWHFVVIQLSDKEHVIDPVLAFARDQSVYFVQVMCRSADDMKVIPLQKLELPYYKLLSINWLNSRTLALIDTSERVHVIDVRSEEEVEVVDLGDVRLVYSSSFYKSLATGGNVSRALAYAGERACYQSIVSSGGQLVLLGTRGVHVLLLRSWTERLDLLAKQDNYTDALGLARSFYDGTAHAIVGLTGNKQLWSKVVAERIMDLLSRYVDLAMTKLCPSHGKMEELETYYQTVVTSCVDHCLLVGRTDFLFGRLYERFSADAIAKATYLECLEPYILNDTLTSLTPVVMKDFIEHHESSGAVAVVETCVVHMDVSSVDIHQVVSLCWAHGLYDALLYVYNRTMADYVSPLEQLLAILAAALATGKQLTYQQIQLGNKILVYISCCLAGRAYPTGDIPTGLISTVRDDILRCVTALHSAKPSDTESVYPHLRTLVQFDTREFFNVLSLAFDDVELDSAEKQRIIDILLTLMVEGVGFSPAQVGILFTFLGRQMARQTDNIIVSRALFEQVLESLCIPVTSPSTGGVLTPGGGPSSPTGVGSDAASSGHEERQQVLLELCSVGGLEHFDPQRLISLAWNAAFYRVCEVVFDHRREFHRIVACYWRDPARCHLTFTYVQTVMSNGSLTEAERDAVREAVVQDVGQLVKIDARRAAKLLTVTLGVSASDVLTQLSNDAVTVQFLAGVFEYLRTAGDTVQISIEPHVYERYVQLLCQQLQADGLPAAGPTGTGPPVTSSTIVEFLRCTSSYRLNEMLTICQQYHVVDAVIYLLEKSGDISGAFDLSIDGLNNKLLSVSDSETGCQGQGHVYDIVSLLQRNSQQLEGADMERMWFKLLDCLMDSLRRCDKHNQQVTNDDLKSLTRHVINSMMSCVALPSILQRIIEREGGGVAGHFGDVRDLLTGVLDACAYERMLLATCARLVNRDLHSAIRALTVAACRGAVPRTDDCVGCGRTVVGGGATVSRHTEALVCFKCGHVFHQRCLLQSAATAATLSPSDSPRTLPALQCSACTRPTTQHVVRPTSTAAAAFAEPSTRSPGKLPAAPAHTKVAEPIDCVQLASLERLRSTFRSPARLVLLSELASQSTELNARSRPPITTPVGIMHHDKFHLRLAPPPAR